MRSKFLLLSVLLAPALVACSSHGGTASDQYISFTGDTLVVKTPAQPDARIGANGDLRIGNAAVAINASQRALLKRYYGEVVAVRDDGIATGKAGASQGMYAVNTVFGNLVAGTPDKIDQEVNARGKTVDDAAQRLCSALLQVKATQGEVAAQLPAFRPYTVFGGEINYFGGDMQCDDSDHPAPKPPAPPIPPQPPQPPPPPSNSAGR